MMSAHPRFGTLPESVFCVNKRTRKGGDDEHSLLLEQDSRCMLYIVQRATRQSYTGDVNSSKLFHLYVFQWGKNEKSYSRSFSCVGFGVECSLAITSLSPATPIGARSRPAAAPGPAIERGFDNGEERCHSDSKCVERRSAVGYGLVVHRLGKGVVRSRSTQVRKQQSRAKSPWGLAVAIGRAASI